MTKPRTPDSFADAMGKVIAQIGAAEAARVASAAAGRPYADRTVYEWANPDSDTLPSLPVALALDAAHQLAGGEDAPFRDAFGHQLGIAVEQQDACRRELVADAAEFMGEASDLSVALLHAAQPGASPLVLHRALVEAQQVDGVVRRIRRRLPRFLRNVTSAGSGNAGGDHQ
ncbi:hypothetical protein NF700_00930 [Sphingomonadaceae bacterium OTU29MARTA1]|nr:hypothetical protein NF700_00930 [Sphingomonadaceae bacterium OTU29MARTA1]